MREFIFVIYSVPDLIVLDWFPNEDDCIEEYETHYKYLPNVHWKGFNIQFLLELFYKGQIYDISV